LTVPPTPSGQATSDPFDSEGTDPSIDALQLGESAPDDPKAKNKPRSFWRELPVLVLIALVLAVIIKTFLVQAFFIPSESMVETLQINDRVLVNKLSYRFGDISRGQVVVFEPEFVEEESLPTVVLRNIGESIGLSTPDSDLIKRVVGLPGETIEIRNNRVFIDGSPIDEPYLADDVLMRRFGPELIPADHYFVMGDNRGSSLDSRSTGPIHGDRIVGRAFVIIWPPSRWGGL
jgi:signal peptidase I